MGEWVATRRPPVAWAALDGTVYAAPLFGGRKAATAVAHGWRTSSCSSPTPASFQVIVRRRDKKEGIGSTATPGHWRDRQRTLKKRQ